jgi:hypothetical protein
MSEEQIVALIERELTSVWWAGATSKKNSLDEGEAKDMAQALYNKIMKSQQDDRMPKFGKK